jgi:hypothetical protein
MTAAGLFRWRTAPCASQGIGVLFWEEGPAAQGPRELLIGARGLPSSASSGHGQGFPCPAWVW